MIFIKNFVCDIKTKSPKALRICECGSKDLIRNSLVKNKPKCRSCSHKTHGHSGSVEHNTWFGIKQRCYYKGHNRYNRYGARGITVCDRWLESFENFLEDMGKRPGPNYSIDRIDNDGNYEPSNCRWATAKEQANNNSIQAKKYFGKTIKELSKEIGIAEITLRQRIKKYGSSREVVFAKKHEQLALTIGEK